MPLIPQDLRVDYGRGQFSETDAAADPITQFERWFADANAAGVPEANAMTLATADSSGVVSARIVLLKGIDARGFAFFTNYDSRKAHDIEANPHAALCFFWQPLERQVRVEGAVETVGRAESESYFRTRPVSAQVGAWASAQSTVIQSRQEIENKERELTEQFAGGPVPLPEFWGGYRVVPNAVEFWQGRPSRLHDRIRYRKQKDGTWIKDRLSP
ncbi:pyridoxamine 5'-phosphate oxidase [Humisphaera borealis]|uniref:Pyridoxine/pyridoxamine 5'-phosphate oxidase n=1 Tax=Humisphaera borealis TaxID=2807512 RepID=A0A7M2WYW1_9BACT|nr:pyridoxamine 5'-phosphate oxidase [Humisphaera borealis]QOV89670.1 pyridoxamine 5'-phosphate oxidase [Humisphaera borealis]